MGFEEEYPIKLRYEDLQAYTDNFSHQNYIGDFQFGKVYHGKVTLPHSAKPKLVTVKIWQIPKAYSYYENENAHRLMDELSFLETIDLSYPGFMKVYGYCIKPEQCGIVYDFKAYNTLFNLATTDEFTWSQRIKAALRLAQLLRYLHVNYKGESPLLIRNIHPAHVMVDEDWNPILYDFGMISGGMFPDKFRFPIQHVVHCHGCYDSYGDTQKTDVCAFGIVLLSLIMKEVYTDEDRKRKRLSMRDRAFIKMQRDRVAFRKSKLEYRSDRFWYEEDAILAEIDDENLHFSLVHESLEADESFYWRDGPTITRLAQACVEFHPAYRPTMNQVVNQLQKLQVIRRQTQLSVFIEGKERMKKEVKREDIGYREKKEVKREDIGYREKKEENIPSQKMEVKTEDGGYGKKEGRKHFIPKNGSEKGRQWVREKEEGKHSIQKNGSEKGRHCNEKGKRSIRKSKSRFF